MKLLMISGDRTLSSGKRGAFAEMLEEFSKQWERIDILCPTPTPTPNLSPDGGGEPRSERGGERKYFENVFVHPSPRGLWYQPFWIRKKGLALIESHQHDVMTVHEYPPFYNGIGARMLKRIKKIPAALEIHHIVGWPEASSLSEFIGRMLSRIFLPSHTGHFDAVRTVNSVTKELLTSWGADFRKIQIVPSFYLDHTLLTASRGQTKQYDLVFCARLVANKGLLEAIDALAFLPVATMLVIGDGPLRFVAEVKVRALGLESRVTFAGWLPDALSVLKAMSSGKIFIMNSKSEGGPRSALEAMGLGLPLIATQVGVLSDVIQNGVNGMLTTGTAADLAEKIRFLLASPEKQATIGREAARITERFERVQAIKHYADFLKDVMARYTSC